MGTICCGRTTRVGLLITSVLLVSKPSKNSDVIFIIFITKMRDYYHHSALRSEHERLSNGYEHRRENQN